MLFIILQKSRGKHLISDGFEVSFTREAGQNGFFCQNSLSNTKKSTSNAIFMTFSIFTKSKQKSRHVFMHAVSPTVVIFLQFLPNNFNWNSIYLANSGCNSSSNVKPWSKKSPNGHIWWRILPYCKFINYRFGAKSQKLATLLVRISRNIRVPRCLFSDEKCLKVAIIDRGIWLLWEKIGSSNRGKNINILVFRRPWKA